MKLFLILLGLAAATALAWRFTNGASAAAGEQRGHAAAAYLVTRGDLAITVEESGALKAKNSVSIQPQFQRQGTVAMLVKEGKTVEKDEILCEFEKTELKNQIEEVKTRLGQAKIALGNATAESAIQTRDSDASVVKADFDLEVACNKLEMYENGEAPNELRQLNLAIEKARSELRRAEERFSKVPDLRAAGFYTKNEEELERINVEERRIEVETAEKKLELFEVYTRPMSAAERLNAVKDAERALTNAKEKAAINAKEREARIVEHESNVKSLEQQLEQLEKELGHMTIRAPQAGIVLYGEGAGNSWWSRQIKVGAQLWPGNTLFTIPDLSEMQVLTSVHEGDKTLVEVGQQALVTLESDKSRSFEAEVTKVADVAKPDNWGSSNAGSVFEVEITMKKVDHKFAAGTTAKVEIQVETLKDVVFVPVHAVFAEDGRNHVFVLDGEEWSKREVTIGKNNSHHVHVAKGLEASERVLLYDPRATGASGSQEAAKPSDAAPAAAPAATPGDAVSAASGAR